MSDVAERDEAAEKPPDSLWERLRADPLHVPEHIALAASERHAPAAAAWADRRRRVYGNDARTLAEMARRRHVTLAGFEGAATGVGGIVTLLPDLVGLAWIQSRLVFFVAAAHGYDPRDPMRPAELLVIRGLYKNPAEARAALDGVGVSVAEAYVGSKLVRDEAIVRRLLLMAGKRGGTRLAGRMIPGFAIAFNAVANRRDTNALAKKTIAFYGGPKQARRRP